MKTAFVTGGSRGIGKAIAIELGNNFHVVVGYSNSEDKANDVAKDIIFSFPVTCKNGSYEIVQGLTIDDFAREKLKVTEDELLQEAKDAEETRTVRHLRPRRQR